MREKVENYFADILIICWLELLLFESLKLSVKAYGNYRLLMDG